MAREAGRDCPLALDFTGGATPGGKQGGFLGAWGQLQQKVRSVPSLCLWVLLMTARGRHWHLSTAGTCQSPPGYF